MPCVILNPIYFHFNVIFTINFIFELSKLYFALFRFQELPKAEALLSGRDLPSDNDMQSLDNNNNNKDAVNNKHKLKLSGSDSDSDSSSSSSDNSFSESDEAEELNRVQIKMPLELSLSDLANAILQQNQKYVAIDPIMGTVWRTFYFSLLSFASKYSDLV